MTCKCVIACAEHRKQLQSREWLSNAVDAVADELRQAGRDGRPAIIDVNSVLAVQVMATQAKARS